MSRAIPANIYLFRVTNRNKRIRCEICPKLTVRALELVFTVNFEYISYLGLVFLMLSLNK